MQVVRDAWDWASRRRQAYALAILTMLTTALALMLVDIPLLREIRHEETGVGMLTVHQLAQALSYWGDFLGFNMAVFVFLGVAAVFRKSVFFRRLVIIAMAGTVICGGLANVGRFLTGRARPSYEGEPGFYGPTFRSRLQSFPSAHTATAFGASVPVAIALPPVGVPLVLISAGVSWSRMQNNRHHPSDVFVSVCLSLMAGVPLGVVVRRMRTVQLQRRRASKTTSVQLDLAALNPATD